MAIHCGRCVWHHLCGLQAVKVHTWAVASAFDSVLLEPAPRTLRDKLRGQTGGAGGSGQLGADAGGVDDVVEQIQAIRQKVRMGTAPQEKMQTCLLPHRFSAW